MLASAQSHSFACLPCQQSSHCGKSCRGPSVNTSPIAFFRPSGGALVEAVTRACDGDVFGAVEESGARQRRPSPSAYFFRLRCQGADFAATRCAVEILVIKCQGKQMLTHQLEHTVLDAHRIAGIGKAPNNHATATHTRINFAQKMMSAIGAQSSAGEKAATTFRESKT